MAESIIKNDPEYLAWVQELSERYRRSQIKAAVSVNREMLLTCMPRVGGARGSSKH